VGNRDVRRFGGPDGGDGRVVTGGDPDRLAQLPDLRGMKDEVIVPRYS